MGGIEKQRATNLWGGKGEIDNVLLRKGGGMAHITCGRMLGRGCGESMKYTGRNGSGAGGVVTRVGRNVYCIAKANSNIFWGTVGKTRKGIWLMDMGLKAIALRWKANRSDE